MDNLLVSGVNLNAEKLVRVSQLNQSIFSRLYLISSFLVLFSLYIEDHLLFIQSAIENWTELYRNRY